MNQATRLHVYEELMLLALRDKEGTIHFGANYLYALGGALLAELLLEKRIEIEDEKKKFVVAKRGEKLGDPLLEECLERIATAKRRAPMRSWVTRFAGIKQLKHRVAQQLCDRGILKADEDKVLLIFTRKIYPERDPTVEREIVARLKSAIFTYTTEVDPRTVVLIALAHPTGLLRGAFDRKKLKDRKKRLDQIVAGNILGQTTKEVMEAVQAAVAAAAVAVTVATTTSH
ncbi:MAG: GPP34 family phosphoprotein [Gemmatimonadota bacterium]|nr:GPP34 family phosphoprotein [Gemmatimonadota bacterium]